MSKQKYEYYVIYFTDKNELQIIENWKEAEEVMKGRPHLVKGVYNLSEATIWLKNIKPKDVARSIFYGQTF